jgi:hypothetical protein
VVGACDAKYMVLVAPCTRPKPKWSRLPANTSSVPVAPLARSASPIRAIIEPRNLPLPASVEKTFAET